MLTHSYLPLEPSAKATAEMSVLATEYGMAQRWKSSKGERGVTLLMVAVGMFSFLTMLVITLDVVNLYISSDQAKRSAEAAALAGAEAFVTSSTTSNPASVPLSTICNGTSKDADLRVQKVAAQNNVAGSSPTTVADSCASSTSNQNPQIQVTVTQTGLPSFFARMWGGAPTTVTATALAEAYNPSVDPANPPSNNPPISIHGVKPWLIFNCNTCPSGALFITSSYGIARGAAFIGQPFTFNLTVYNGLSSTADPPSGTAPFFAIDPPAPLACPSVANAVSCGQIGTGPPGLYYHDNIACEGSFNFTNGQTIGPGQPIQVDTLSAGNLHTLTIPGTTCLIHASTTGLDQGQDSFTSGSLPVTITGGSNNPNPSLRSVVGIHRSDSVVAVPVFNCPSAGPCDNTVQLPIVGFLQIGIQDVNPTGDIDAVILNAAALDPASTETTIVGAGTSPVAVRLIHP